MMSSRRRWMLILSLCLATFGGVVALLPTRSSGEVTPQMPEWLETAALHRLAQCGSHDSVPVDWGLCDMASVSAVLGKSTDLLTATELSAQYYVVVAHGEFTYENARVGPGAIPTGDWIVLVIDPTTRETLTFGIGEGSLDTSLIADVARTTL